MSRPQRADLPPAQGLYDPEQEHDACGVAAVVDLRGRRSHDMVAQGLRALLHLEHRGAAGAEPNTGDGAGISIQVPHGLLREVVDFDLPDDGHYAVGTAFLSADRDDADIEAARIEQVVRSEALRVLGWREVPHDDSMIGSLARDVMPSFRQVFVGAPEGRDDHGIALERRVFMARKRIRHEVGVYLPSLSPRTLVYKGMLNAPQLADFYPDLADERLTSALALVHSRFSTNTFPSWPLAHPYRYIAHNGEINTLKGNRNWMRAREALMRSDVLPGDLERIFPVITPGASDSASFDECLELLHLAGRPLHHAVLMMIPEAWENHETMDPAKRAFYQFHSSFMEAWDGPAFIAFTDGTVMGAVLDRNGLRPARYWVTADDRVIMASEVGVLDVPSDQIVHKGRLEPGRMFLVDTEQGRIIGDDEIKAELAAAEPYGEYLRRHLVPLEDLPRRAHHIPAHTEVRQQQVVFGYTHEELKILLGPMARNGAEPIGSMGTDTPLAVLSDRPRQLYDYFKQLFAQVTNPPLDAIREEMVTSMTSSIGPEGNLLHPEPTACRQIELPYPVITTDELGTIVRVNEDGDRPEFEAHVLSGLYDVSGGGQALAVALDRVCIEASEAIERGAKILVLTDRGADDGHAPIPSLLLTAAVHHHLIREKSRTKIGLIVESGDCREVHHVALLIGYGAGAVCPYVAFDSITDMIGEGQLDGVEEPTAHRNLVKALSKGVIKIMSKIGVSTVASYAGAQIFEAIGVRQEVIDRYFTGTTSRLQGMGLDEIAAEVARRHHVAFLENTAEVAHRDLDYGGEYQWRREGEHHLFNPETVYRLQHSTRTGRYDIFKEYTKMVDDQSARMATLRGLFRFRDGEREPVSIDEVEPVSEIVKRFSTGAMSYGSISKEAHETLAIAMNRIGGKSNTGEGGEDADRYEADPSGDLRRSAIKQVASGRFGVTSEYLVNADDLQIKMAQGAKPGEGGQLPGRKVWPWIARTRYSTAGVGLISPPPHHDIYSIEDLKQLIHDLKNANPEARVHVKLVSEVGVGTVAAGVSKAKADVVLISGHDGGTGASPLNSIKHAGSPWELGLAETQQTLLLNGLRDRIVVQTDGQLKTGRDVVIAALLGADEYGFATAPLVVSGCVMMRVCHLDTCPVGVATQNPVLRERFDGKPEFVVNFMEFVAEEVRELLAQLGFRTLDEAIGHVEVLDFAGAVDHWKAAGLDVSPILHRPTVILDQDLHHSKGQDHGLDRALDNELIERSAPALERGETVRFETPIANVNRTVGTMLGSRLTRAHGGEGLPDGTIDITFRGSAGQSFGAFVPRGITLRLIGDANDYLGKGLSGGRIVVRPPEDSPFVAEENVISGNVILYGATAGEVFVRGVVGERFCVRNSGALAVVEGVGDHACEYMTGGRAIVLGPTGRNFAAGMSGGIAYVLDCDGWFPSLVNVEMVDLDPIDGDDDAFLRETIGRHLDETGSTVADKLLAEWEQSIGLFVKVVPRDYKRVLEAARVALEQGDDVDAAVMAAAHG